MWLPKEQLQEMVDAVPGWFHSLDLGEGVITKGHKSVSYLEKELAALRLPDLKGKSVLDIGAWDGFYSFAAERHGAERVLALDHYVWSIDWAAAPGYVRRCEEQGVTPGPWHTAPDVWRPDELPGKRGFDTAHRALGSKVQSLVVDFMEADLGEVGVFDVVLYLGVLYHMENPLAALKRVAAVTREVAVIETDAAVFPGFEHLALCEFFESNERANDPTNWWAPNERALEALCRAAGFQRVETMTGALEEKPRLFPKRGPRRYRGIAHAWK